MEASQFLRADTADEATGLLTFSGGFISGSATGTVFEAIEQVLAPVFHATGTATSTFAGGFETNGRVLFQNTVDSTTGFQIKDADGGTSVLNVDTAAERVGIGTDAPAVPLHVAAGGGRFSAGGNGETVGAYSSATHVWSLGRQGTPSNASLSISALGGIGFKGGQSSNASSDYHITITSAGNTGIGTTTPRSKMHVSSGASGTTTVDWGDPTSTSKVCHNTKNAEGDEISFYFVGTTMVVENNRCVE